MDIIVIISACIFLLFAVVGQVRYKCIVNPVTVFCGLWAVILLGYSMHAYGLYDASDESLYLVIIGTVMFFFGAVCVSLLRLKQTAVNSTVPSIESDSDRVNYGVLLLLNVLVFVFLVSFAVRVMVLLLSGHGFAYIHRMYNVTGEDGILGESSVNRSIISWFVWPVLHASLASFAVLIQCDSEHKNKLKKWCFLIIVANAALFTLISGKRSFIFELVVFFLAVSFMRGKKISLSRRSRFIIALLVVVIILGFVVISNGRGTTSFISLFYIYIVGCIPNLSIRLQGSAVDPVGLTSIYGFFHAPITIINVFLHSELLSSIRDSMSQLVEYTQQKALIGSGVSFNAFVTPFYFFYLDGGWTGNVVLSFLFGFLSTCVYHVYLRRRDYKSVVLYLLVFFSLYMSMVRFQYFQMRFVLSFFYAFMVFGGFRVKFNLGRNRNGLTRLEE